MNKLFYTVRPILDESIRVTQTTPPFGILLVNLGTPEAATTGAVRRYLAEFLNDTRVVDAPRWLWWLVLNGIILRTRPKKVAKAYQQVWQAEGSPLLVISKQQQQALQQQLQAEFKQHIPVELAMTYGSPNITQALNNLTQRCERVLILPLFPQYSSSTTAAVYDAVAKDMAQRHLLPETRWLNQYFNHPLYIQALADSVRAYRAEHGQGDKLLLSFHGIPERYALRGDPYPEQCRTTAKLVAESLGLNDDQWLCSFQSRFGREEWVKPYTDKVLEQWAHEKLGRVDVISPAFAADCLETLEELDVENRALFTQHGGGEYHYIPCLNAQDDHIQLLVELVKQHSQGWV